MSGREGGGGVCVVGSRTPASLPFLPCVSLHAHRTGPRPGGPGRRGSGRAWLSYVFVLFCLLKKRIFLIFSEGPTCPRPGCGECGGEGWPQVSQCCGQGGVKAPGLGTWGVWQGREQGWAARGRAVRAPPPPPLRMRSIARVHPRQALPPLLSRRAEARAPALPSMCLDRRASRDACEPGRHVGAGHVEVCARPFVSPHLLTSGDRLREPESERRARARRGMRESEARRPSSLLSFSLQSPSSPSPDAMPGGTLAQPTLQARPLLRGGGLEPLALRPPGARAGRRERETGRIARRRRRRRRRRSLALSAAAPVLGPAWAAYLPLPPLSYESPCGSARCGRDPGAGPPLPPSPQRRARD